MSFRLLVIEDSPTQLLSIRKILEQEGHEVISAKNGAEGLVLAYNETPDLIISDIVMTGINGYQVCRLVKNDPELSNTPVILLTRLDGSVDKFWGLKSGADKYIPKEPGFNSLLKATREILAQTSIRAHLRAVANPEQAPSIEEINSRLNQLLERLLFEATIIDEVRHIGEDLGDIEIISEKLFILLSSIVDYQAGALVVNHGNYSIIHCDAVKESQETQIKSYAMKIALQLGLPPSNEDLEKNNSITNFENALTQPIDTSGMRVGLLVLVPLQGQSQFHSYKAGDQKVIRLICEQLATVLRHYLSYTQKYGKMTKV